MISRFPLWVACMSLLMACGGAPSRTTTDTGLKDLKPEQKPALREALIQTMIDAQAYDSAVPLLRQALAETPKSARLHCMLGTVLRERGRYEQAMGEFKIALGLAPRLSEAHGGLAMTYNLLGRHAEATKAHRSAVALHQRSARLLNNLGFSLYLEGKFADAAAAYEKAVHADPNLSLAYVNLGFALAAQNKMKAAERAFSQVLKPAAILNNMALAQELRGNPDGARSLYQQAVGLDPGLDEAITNLSAVERRQETKE